MRESLSSSSVSSLLAGAFATAILIPVATNKSTRATKYPQEIEAEPAKTGISPKLNAPAWLASGPDITNITTDTTENAIDTISRPTIAFVFGFLQRIIVIKNANTINNALRTKKR